MAAISNRAITLSDSLKNTVDTQDTTSKTQMYWTMLYNTYVYWILLKWPEKSEQEERKRGKNVSFNLLQPLHWYCGQRNTLSYRNQGSEPAKLDLVKERVKIALTYFFPVVWPPKGTCLFVSRVRLMECLLPDGRVHIQKTKRKHILK